MKTHAHDLRWLVAAIFIAISACTTQAPAGNAAAPAVTTSPTPLPSAPTTLPPTSTSIPTVTEPPAVPTPTVVEYPHKEKPLVAIPSITVSADAGDPRIPLVQKAVDYWNGVF